MPQPPPDPPVADQAPDADVVTDNDHRLLGTYLRLLDAEAEGVDWAEVTRIVLHIDPLYGEQNRYREALPLIRRTIAHKTPATGAALPVLFGAQTEQLDLPRPEAPSIPPCSG